MNKVKTSICLALCVLMLAGCASQRPGVLSALETRTPDLEGIERSQRIENGSQYFMNVQAPVTRSAPVNKDVNAVIAAEVDAFFDMLPDTVEEEWQDSGLTIEYETNRYNDEIVTFVFEVYTYVAGAAHGLSHAVTRTYDLGAGERIALEDLFSAPLQEALARLSEQSRQLLAQGQLGEYLDADWVKEGTEPIEENFARFVVLPHGLQLIFDPYQVGPWAIGEQRVLIPWEGLEDILNR